MGHRNHQDFTMPSQIKNNGLFYMKLISNNNSYYVHRTNKKIKHMLWHHRIIHRSRSEKTTKLINGIPTVCDIPKKDCLMCTSTNVPRALKTQYSIANPAISTTSCRFWIYSAKDQEQK